MGDSLGFHIQRVCAVIPDIIVEGIHLLFITTGGRAVMKGLANTFDVDLDSHPAGLIVNDDARRMIVGKVKSGVCTHHRNQSPSSDQLLTYIFLLRLSGGHRNA